MQTCWKSVYLKKKKVSWRLKGGELWRGLTDTDVKNIPKPAEGFEPHVKMCSGQGRVEKNV